MVKVKVNGQETIESQMNLAGQGDCVRDYDLFRESESVWFTESGQVRSEWLSMCKEKRLQTKSKVMMKKPPSTSGVRWVV